MESGVVHEYVDRFETLHDARDCAARVLFGRHVGAQTEGRAALALDGRGRCERGALVDVDDGNRRAAAREGRRVGSTDSPPPLRSRLPRDPRNPSSQSPLTVSFSIRECSARWSSARWSSADGVQPERTKLFGSMPSDTRPDLSVTPLANQEVVRSDCDVPASPARAGGGRYKAFDPASSYIDRVTSLGHMEAVQVGHSESAEKFERKLLLRNERLPELINGIDQKGARPQPAQSRPCRCALARARRRGSGLVCHRRIFPFAISQASSIARRAMPIGTPGHIAHDHHPIDVERAGRFPQRSGRSSRVPRPGALGRRCLALRYRLLLVPHNPVVCQLSRISTSPIGKTAVRIVGRPSSSITGMPASVTMQAALNQVACLQQLAKAQRPLDPISRRPRAPLCPSAPRSPQVKRSGSGNSSLASSRLTRPAK